MKERNAATTTLPASPLRVVIADDMELIRIGLYHALAPEPDLSVIGAAADGREAVELCVQLRPELALIDERMPIVDGIEAARQIKQRSPLIRVIILSPQGDAGARVAAIRAGADIWLPKHISRDELVATLRRAHHSEMRPGQRPKPGPPPTSIGDTSAHTPPATEPLTPRELDVLRLLVQGKTNSEIAYGLALSRGTVKAYVEQIIAKFHVSSRTHAAVRALELNILHAPLE